MTATATLPATHVDLLERPLPAVLTTEMPDGRLQSSVVWCDLDGNNVLINTMREFQKAATCALGHTQRYWSLSQATRPAGSRCVPGRSPTTGIRWFTSTS